MDRRVRKTLELLESLEYRKIRVGELAANVNLSVSRLEHLFKENVGVAIRELIRMKRLAKAAALIEETDLSISRVLRLAGFTDLADFDHAFKREFGMSPREYRKAHERLETRQVRPGFSSSDQEIVADELE